MILALFRSMKFTGIDKLGNGLNDFVRVHDKGMGPFYDHKVLHCFQSGSIHGYFTIIFAGDNEGIDPVNRLIPGDNRQLLP